MENGELLAAIDSYCHDHNFHFTAAELQYLTVLRTGADTTQDSTENLTETFEKYFNKQLRILSHQKAKCAQSDIPNDFLLLLDELGFNPADAQLLYDNRDEWNYEKKDGLIYCTKKCKDIIPNCIFYRLH